MKRLVLAAFTLIILGLCVFVSPDPETVQPEDWAETGLLEPRSPHWPSVRAEYVKAHPFCAACGKTSSLNVHHIKPFHTNPNLELDPSNLITLCRDHHFRLGHLSNWSKSNPNVVKDAYDNNQTIMHNRSNSR